jgi:hypothetical protein
MRSKRLDLSELCRFGLSPTSSKDTRPGLISLKNLRSNGSALVGCSIESIQSTTSCIPFSRDGVDYLIKSDGVYSFAGSLLFSRTFVGQIKIVDLIKVTWIQDSVVTIFVDSTGISLVNPTGYALPISNSLIEQNGQIIAGGLVLSDGEDFIRWSDISLENFSISKQNTAGLFNPNIGKVFACGSLFDSVILLGSSGACLMRYAEQTFGFKTLTLPIIKDKNLWASSRSFVYYVSKDNELIKVDKDGSFETLGYSWLCSQALTLRYFKKRNWIVLSTSVESFILDDKGMFSFGYKVYGEFATKLAVQVGFEQTSWSFQTRYSDLGKTGLKEVLEVYIADGLSDQLRYVTCFTDRQTVTTNPKRLNRYGSTKYPSTGELLSISYSSEIEPYISGISLELVDNDKRFGAGYVPYGGQK